MSFKLDLNADISDTSWVDAIKVSPAEFVRIFGGPRRYFDECKVSGLYSFIDREKVFTVYDWKSTSLWGDDLPSPLTFWNSRRQEELSIGGNCDDAAEFRSWLLQLLEARKMTDETSGFYKDDGTRIDPSLAPKPLLCETCRRDGLNEEEIVLCILTRSDQEDEESFKCAAYEPKLSPLQGCPTTKEQP